MKIVFHGANAANFRKDFERLLPSPHMIVELSDGLDAAGERETFESADVIVGNKLGKAEPDPKAVRLYHAPAAGTDMIDVTKLPAGAALCNCFGHEDAIAEYVMASLLLRHVPLSTADGRLRQGHWDYWAGRPGALRTELGATTIGLLGFGHIGKAIAKRAKAFGMKVTVANRSPLRADVVVDQDFGLDTLPAFMKSADSIVVSLPLVEQTRGIVDARSLAAMRPGAVIVNVGRGPVIDEQALFDALSQRRIGGAIIDTWYVYPTLDSPTAQPSRLPFHTLDNVVMTPHMSGWTIGTVRRRQETIAENIERLERGQPLNNSLPH